MEDFFKDYQYTFSAMAAIGTMLAVTLSLWLSSNQHRSKIVADVDKRVIDRKNGVMISVARYTDITKDGLPKQKIVTNTQKQWNVYSEFRQCCS